MIEVKYGNPGIMSTDDINESFISTSMDMSSNYYTHGNRIIDLSETNVFYFRLCCEYTTQWKIPPELQ